MVAFFISPLIFSKFDIVIIFCLFMDETMNLQDFFFRSLIKFDSVSGLEEGGAFLE